MLTTAWKDAIHRSSFEGRRDERCTPEKVSTSMPKIIYGTVTEIYAQNCRRKKPATKAMGSTRLLYFCMSGLSS